jgi:hypothetical protein
VAILKTSKIKLSTGISLIKKSCLFSSPNTNRHWGETTGFQGTRVTLPLEEEEEDRVER